MATSGYLTTEYLPNLTAPFNNEITFNELTQSDLGKEVINNLWVNRDKTNPDFAQSPVTTWDIDGIPTSIVGIQVDANRTYALVYFAGVPDYVITEPGITNEPTNQYGILKVPTTPIAETDVVHTLSSSNYVGIFVNGSGIFNYTDTFTWERSGVWSYEAFKAEAAAINDDGAHANPTGAYHNHVQSADTLERLNDPFVQGVSQHSLLVGYALDGHGVYGPLGYTTKTGTDELKVLRSSYVTRNWLDDTTGNRSSLPEWAVANWDGQAVSGTNVLNLTGLAKSAALYSDGVIDGVVSYSGTDTSLASEITWYNTAANGHLLKEDAAGYAYWEHTVALPDDSGSVQTKNYLLKSSSLWGPGYEETIQPGMYPEDRKEEFSFVAEVGSFAEDYEYVQGYGDLDFYNGIDSYIPALGKSEYHYVTSFSSNLTDSHEDRLEGVAFPYVIWIQYKGEVDTFNSDGATRIAFLGSATNGLETVYDLGITEKDDAGTLVTGSIIDTWESKQTATPTMPGGGTGMPPGGGTGMPPGGTGTSPGGTGTPPGGTTTTPGGTTTTPGGTTTTPGGTTTTPGGTITTPGGTTATPGGTTTPVSSINPIVTQTVDGNTVDLIDLRSFTGSVTVNYSYSRESKYDNEVYFYRVDDVSGSIGGVTVDSANYLSAAFDRIVSPVFATGDGGVESGTIQLEAGLLAPLIISNGSLAQGRVGAAQVYTAYLNTNTDDRTFDHVQVSNGKTFGFEDLFNGGDRDFNDLALTFSNWSGTKSPLTV